jgi:hypothetical protein
VNVIFKYGLEPGPQRVILPSIANLLHVGAQEGRLFMWAQVQSDAIQLERRIHVYGTGHAMGEAPGAYVGTAIVGPYVWHVFDEGLA